MAGESNIDKSASLENKGILQQKEELITVSKKEVIAHKKEVEITLPDTYEMLLIKANTFKGTQREVSILDVEIGLAIDRLIDDIAVEKGKTPIDQVKIDNLKLMREKLTVAKVDLPGLFVKNLIATIDKNKNTPAPNEIKQLIQDIDFALAEVNTRLSNPSITPQEKSILEGQEKTLNAAKDKLGAREDNQELNDAIAKYVSTYESIRKDIGTQNLDQLNSVKTIVGEVITKMETTYLLSKGAAGYISGLQLDPDVIRSLLTQANKFDSLSKELDDRILLETYLQTYRGIQDTIKRTELEKNAGWKKEIKKLTEQSQLLGFDIDNVVTKLKEYKDIDPATIKLRDVVITNTVPNTVVVSAVNNPANASRSIPKNSSNNAPISAPTLNNTASVVDLIDMSDLGIKVDDAFMKQVLDMYRGGALVNIDGLNANQRKYLQVYHQRVTEHITGVKNESEADFLKWFVKEDSKFNTKDLGSISDFRDLAKNIKAESKEMNKKSKYLMEAFPHLMAYACARQFNVSGLESFDAILRNGPALDHNHTAPALRTGTDIWGAPCNLGLVAEQWFGPGWRECVSNMKLPAYCCVGQRGRVFSTFFPPEMWYPMDIPGTNAHKKPEIVGDAFISKTANGTWEIVGNMSNDALIALYLSEYNSKVLSSNPETKNLDITNPKIAHQITQRWFAPGSYGVDVIGDLMRRGKTLDEAQAIGDKILTDALRYDDDLVYQIRDAYSKQTDFYWAVIERKTGQRVTDRDVSKIPEDQRYRMLSRAAVEGFRMGFGGGIDMKPVIEDRLSSVYGGSWGYKGELITNSNEVVGQDIARLIDGQRKGSAIEGRTMRDFGSLDQIVDQVQTHGVFDAAGNAITTGLQQLPWMRPENAKRIGGTLATVGKIAAVIFVAKGLLGRIGKGSEFWGKLWRVGAVGAGIALFGKDLYALGFGGKGGMIADAMHHYLDKSDDYDNRNLSAQEMLGFSFGNLTINELLSNLQVNKQSGQFEFKPEIQASFAAMGLAKEQTELLNSLLGSGKSGLNQMVHEGLRESDIRPDNMDAVKAMYGTVKLKDYIAQKVLFSNYKKSIANALGVDADDPRVDDVEKIYGPLNETERTLLLERVTSLEGLTKQYSGSKVLLFDHLFHAKRGIVEAQLGDPAEVTKLETGFQNNTAINALRDAYLLGNAPFDRTKTIAENNAVYESEMKNIFGDSPYYDILIGAKDGVTQIETLFTDPAHPDTKTVMGLEDKTWFVNRTDTSLDPSQRYTEAIMDLGNKERIMIGVEPTAVGSTTNALVMRTPQADGSRAKWRLRSLGDRSDISGVGRGTNTTTGAEEFTIRANNGTSYEDYGMFNPNLMKSIAHNIKANTPSFELSDNDYATGVSPSKKDVVTLERVSGEDRR